MPTTTTDPDPDSEDDRRKKKEEILQAARRHKKKPQEEKPFKETGAKETTEHVAAQNRMQARRKEINARQEEVESITYALNMYAQSGHMNRLEAAKQWLDKLIEDKKNA